MVLCTVLVVDHDLINPTITGKYFCFYISMVMVSVSAILLFWKYKRHITLSVIDLLAFVFIMYNAVLNSYLSDRIGLKFILFA